jgi:hypothetical protein
MINIIVEYFEIYNLGGKLSETKYHTRRMEAESLAVLANEVVFRDSEGMSLVIQFDKLIRLKINGREINSFKREDLIKTFVEEC